ncbi:MAG: hypothetical protein MUF73_16325 [Rhodobacteraceae bacterium]|jgi:hypothetical protein|nr:hypothetical protein [Paracoccaceae bacterium]
MPAPALADILRPALAPCTGFGTCREALWDPGAGHVPRGFLGATGRPDEVEVVMVLAEPGTPYPGSGFRSGTAADLMAQAVADTHRTIRDSQDLFHRNLRWFLNQLWPGRPFDDQLRHVWITEGRLCSVAVESGGLRDATCADRYLRAQIAALPGAVVVGFGGKAQAYLRRLRVPHLAAYALAPPGANHRPARPSWEAAIAAIRARRTGRAA